MSKLFRKQTKRIKAAKRYKVEKKIREHHRKIKKQTKKQPKKHQRAPKDIGVPNSLPFKMDVLNEIQEKKRILEELKAKRKEERQNLQMSNRGLQDIEKEAQNRAKEFDKKEEEKFKLANELKTMNPLIGNQNAYTKEFQKVVDSSDVILEVIDARDPLGTRCSTVEHAVISSSTDKKLVLVLNKIDLVPRENLLQWLKYLRNYFPTIPFKASTQLQKKNLARTWVPIHSKGVQLSNCLGAEALMKVLGSYTRSGDIRKTITVGVVGFPNVGKSSLINSLKRCKACNVGSTPGITKFKQTIRLDKHITLLDSPGVILAKTSAAASEAERTAIVLKNAARIENLDDPITPAESIVLRANREQLMRFYKLPSFSTPNEFLVLFAKRFGRLKKGGRPNIRFAAKTILQDWNVGKIKYYTEPPEENSSHLGTEIVEKLAKPFDLSEFLGDQENELKGLPVVLPSEAIQVESFGVSEAQDGGHKMEDEEVDAEQDSDDDDDKEESDDDEMEVQEPSKTVVRFKEPKQSVDSKPRALKAPKEKAKQRLRSSRVQVPDGIGHHESEEGDQLNKIKKMKFKDIKRRMKRQQRKSDKLESMLSEELSSAMTLSKQESYSFEADFK